MARKLGDRRMRQDRAETGTDQGRPLGSVSGRDAGSRPTFRAGPDSIRDRIGSGSRWSGRHGCSRRNHRGKDGKRRGRRMAGRRRRGFIRRTSDRGDSRKTAQAAVGPGTLIDRGRFYVDWKRPERVIVRGPSRVRVRGELRLLHHRFLTFSANPGISENSTTEPSSNTACPEYLPKI